MAFMLARAGASLGARRLAAARPVLAAGRFGFVAQARAFSSFKYLESHEYVKMDGKIATIGISDFAQTQLGDVVFVDLPMVGDQISKGDSFGSVESVKAASDVYSPVSGVVTEINNKLLDSPELVNSHAMSDAWFIKVEVDEESDLDDLLDETKYAKLVAEEEH